MNTMTYKGYAARIEYNDEGDCFVGHWDFMPILLHNYILLLKNL